MQILTLLGPNMMLEDTTRYPKEEKFFAFGRRTLEKPLEPTTDIIIEGYSRSWHIPKDIVEVAFIASGYNLKYRDRLLRAMWPHGYGLGRGGGF